MGAPPGSFSHVRAALSYPLERLSCSPWYWVSRPPALSYPLKRLSARTKNSRWPFPKKRSPGEEDALKARGPNKGLRQWCRRHEWLGRFPCSWSGRDLAMVWPRPCFYGAGPRSQGLQAWALPGSCALLQLQQAHEMAGPPPVLQQRQRATACITRGTPAPQAAWGREPLLASTARGPLAKWTRHRTSEPRIVGSSPTGGVVAGTGYSCVQEVQGKKRGGSEANFCLWLH